MLVLLLLLLAALSSSPGLSLSLTASDLIDHQARSAGNNQRPVTGLSPPLSATKNARGCWFEDLTTARAQEARKLQVDVVQKPVGVDGRSRKAPLAADEPAATGVPAKSSRRAVPIITHAPIVVDLDYVPDTAGGGWAGGIIALGSDHQVYASKVANLAALTEVSAIPKSDHIMHLAPSPANGSYWFALGGRPNNLTRIVQQPRAWMTMSGPEGFVRSKLGGLPATWGEFDYTTLRLHPSQPKWMLLLVRDGASPTSRSLYVSLDMGESWVRKRSNVESASWCHAGLKHASGMDIPEMRVCMVADLDTNEADGGGASRFATSDQLGEAYSVTVALPFPVSSWVSHPRYMFLVGSINGGTESTALYVSTDNGLSFARAQLPGNLPVPFFRPEQILDDRHGVVWIGVDHSAGVNPGVNWGTQQAGTVYASDISGLRFARVLDDVSVFNNWWDVTPIESLEGTVIANVLVDWNGPGQTQQQSSSGAECEYAYPVRSMITWNEGRDWFKLAPPAASTCKLPGCSLNVFGKTTWLSGATGNYYGDVEGSSSAVGLIVATGNTGRTLSTEMTEVSTFISRDGGVTWENITKASTVYEFGDRGGVMAFAENFSPHTYELKYTTDFGKTIKSISMGHPMCVLQIYAVDGTGSEIAVSGWSGDCYSETRMVLAVDFSPVMGEATCADSDYEEWTLTGAGKTSCPLGHTIKYERRKPGSTCISPTDFSHGGIVTNCACTDHDYECDVGFSPLQLPADGRFACGAVTEDAARLISDPCSTAVVPPGGGAVTVSRGYRKVPLDTCTGQVERYEPRTIHCDGSGSAMSDKSSNTNNAKGLGAVAVMLIIGTVVMVLVGLFVLFVIGGKKGWWPQLRLPGGSGGHSFQPLESSPQGSDDESDTVSQGVDSNMSFDSGEVEPDAVDLLG